MKSLLPLALFIDKINEKFAEVATWAMFIGCMISALNATVRYTFNKSSNGFLEVQWYAFGFTIMLGAALVLKMNEHVRVDIIYGKLSSRTQARIDLWGTVLFLMPACLLMVYMSWPWFLISFNGNEMSSNAGGLIRWPAKLAIPLGFALLAIQGFSEIIKRACYLNGSYEMNVNYEKPLQ
jgi:TRAP-type mannitol/chloroaromatic compound transport system permease small subunit